MRKLDREEFTLVRNSPLVVSDTVASLRFTCSARHNRFSVVVSKALAPRAIDRNKIRRQAYEIVRSLDATINGIIYIKAKKISFKTLSLSITNLVYKATKKCKASLER